MTEKTIHLEEISPLDIFGVNDEKIELIKSYFPQLKIVARGHEIKVAGTTKEINSFDDKVSQIITYYGKYQQLTKNNIEAILSKANHKEEDGKGDDILVYGPSGNLVKAKTANQRKLVSSFSTNDIIFAIGPAGTGKTYTAVALAVQALKSKQVKRIVLTRPAVEAGESLGFLPGDLKEKLDPYLQPLYDALRDMLPAPTLKSYLEKGVIEIAPLAFMRGRTLNNAVILLDEAQNATMSQLRMLLTRMGPTAKICVTGDITQIDLPASQTSGLLKAKEILGKIKGIDFIHLSEVDVVRHNLVKKIITAFNKTK